MKKIKKDRRKRYPFLIAGILLLVIFGVVLYRLFLSPVELIAEEKQIVSNWLDTKPIVKTELGLKEEVLAAKWDGRMYFNIYNKKGSHVGQIAKKALIQGIQANTIPAVAVITPMPPIPVPPPLPFVSPQPTPVPTPTPTPPPLQPMPTPSPTPTPTPIPTPTPTPTPIPIPTPTPPPPTPAYPSHCSDGKWSGDESDLDCGGSCTPCPPKGFPTYLSCWDNNDCASRNCDRSNAQPLPAIDPNTGAVYTTLQQLRSVGQLWIIPYQGICR